MKISVFGFAKTRRFATIALLASFVFSNAFAVGVVNNNKTAAFTKSAVTAKYTTDLTQLGRDGRLQENESFNAETAQLINALVNGNGRQPVVVDEDKAASEAVVEQLAIRIANGSISAKLADRTILKLETAKLFSNANSSEEAAAMIDAIVADAVAANGKVNLVR